MYLLLNTVDRKLLDDSRSKLIIIGRSNRYNVESSAKISIVVTVVNVVTVIVVHYISDKPISIVCNT